MTWRQLEPQKPEQTPPRVAPPKKTRVGPAPVRPQPIIIHAAIMLMFMALAALLITTLGIFDNTRDVSATAEIKGDDIVVTWRGGVDNAYVDSYIIKVNSIEYGPFKPIVEDKKYYHIPDNGIYRVEVIATLTDGSEQYVLDTYLGLVR